MRFSGLSAFLVLLFLVFGGAYGLGMVCAYRTLGLSGVLGFRWVYGLVFEGFGVVVMSGFPKIRVSFFFCLGGGVPIFKEYCMLWSIRGTNVVKYCTHLGLSGWRESSGVWGFGNPKPFGAH